MNKSYLLVILVTLLLTVSLVSPAFAYVKKPSPTTVVEDAEKLPSEAYEPLIEQVVSEADAYFERQGRYVDPTLHEISGPTRVILAVRDDVPAADIAKHMFSCRVVPNLGSFYLALGVVTPNDLEKLLSIDGVVIALRDVDLSDQIGFDLTSLMENVEDHLVWIGDYSPDFQSPEEYNGESRNLKPEPMMWSTLDAIYARDAQDELKVNGSGVTIAIVDTGVDFGSFALSYPDYIARDSAGMSASLDADALGLAITNLTVVAYEGMDGYIYINTTDADPYMYLSIFGFYYGNSTVVRLSNITGMTVGFDYNVTGILEAGETCKFGAVVELWGWWLVYTFEIVVDADGDGVYDTVYFDLLGDGSFSNDPAVNATNPIIAMDLNGDGVNDVSIGSLGHFLDVWQACPNEDERGGILEPIDDEGNYVSIVYDFYGHGTSCASVAAGKYGWSTGAGHPYVGWGVAPEANLMAVTSLFIGDVIEGLLWAAGFDLVPGTGNWTEVAGYGTVWGVWTYTGDHKADVISNSWGISEWAEWFAMNRMHWYDVLTILEDCLMVPGLLDPDYPGTVVVHALGNGGPGYGTVTGPGYGFLPISVGASTEMSFSEWYYSLTWPYIGYAGGLRDEVIPWSARGPTPLGTVEPDVVAVGAFDAAALPVWYVYGWDGTEAWDIFGGTSMATPVTAGVSALVIQAYRIAHGEDPTPEMVKLIIKSTADDLGYDPFVQGAGRINAYRASALALGMAEAVLVSSTASWENLKPLVEHAWAAGHLYFNQTPEAMPEVWSDVSWFAGIVRPGESSSAVFTLTNLDDTYDMDVSLTPVTYELINSTMLTNTTDLTDPSYVLKLAPEDIPEDADMMVVYLNMSFSDVWCGPLYLYVGIWNDTNGDNLMDETEVTLISYSANVGPTQEARVATGLSYLRAGDGVPVIYLRQGWWWRPLNFTLTIEFWKRVEYENIAVEPSTLTVPAGGSANFTATLTVPSDQPMGVYEYQILVNATLPDGGYVVTAIPVSVVVPLVVPEDALAVEVTPPDWDALYDPYRVRGLFDWMWRYESGDWRVWPIEITDPTTVAAFVTCSWTGNLTDVDMFALDPTHRFIDSSTSPYWGGGVFGWETRTNETSDWVYMDTSPMGTTAMTGVYTVLLHNVLFNGTVFPEELNCTVELVKLAPRGTLDNPIYVYAKPGDNVTLTFTVSTGLNLTYVSGVFAALGYSWPIYVGDVGAESSETFNVTFTVPEDTEEGVYPALMMLDMAQIPENQMPIMTYLTIVVDKTAPMVSIYAPEDGSILRGAVNVSLFGFDAYIDRVELYIDNTLVETWDYSGNFTYLLNTTSYADGLHNMTVYGFDLAGNSANATVFFVFDNTPPTADITAPTANATYVGNVTITYSASDPLMACVTLYIDGAPVANWSHSGSFEYVWDTTKYGDGAHTITLVAKDLAGNVATDSMTVYTANVARAKAAARNMGIVVGAIPLLIVGIAIGYLIKRS